MKHAYLVMAHNQIPILKMLIEKLDDENNDIYIHLDIKCKFPVDGLKAVSKHSNIYFVKRTDVLWGDFSQIQCEINLLKAAITKYHDYYHLITGVDLPIKDNKFINDFFKENKGRQYISFDKIALKTMNFSKRYDKWHFTKQCPSNKFHIKLAYFVKNKMLMLCEFAANFFSGDRSKKYKDIQMMKGSAYFDITHNCAQYVVTKEPEIKKMFKFTICCDEVFLHTIIFNSPFKNDILPISTRYIDWSKRGGSPEILTMEHYNAIIKSKRLFARKFSMEQSKLLIEKLYNTSIN